MKRNKESIRVSLLLLSVLMLWEVLTYAPLFDSTFPLIHISSLHPDVFVPVLEFVIMALGILLILAGYYLFMVAAKHSMSLLDNLLFLICAGMFISGNGLHMGCIITETNIRNLELNSVDALLALVHFMHEYWSHNSMQVGLFGMLLLAAWKETSVVRFSQATFDKEKCCASTVDHNMMATHVRQRSCNGAIQNGRTVSHSVNKTKTNCNKFNETYTSHHDLKETGSYYLLSLFTQWIVPLQTGYFFTVFSRRTSTEIITTCFYVSILAMLLLCKKSISECRNSDTSILSILSKASILGLVLMCYSVVYKLNFEFVTE